MDLDSALIIEDEGLREENRYTVEYVFGKKQTGNEEPHYAVKWDGYDKSEMTWEPASSFKGESELILRRFERCYAYRFYHTKINSRRQGVNIRVHIMGKYCQVTTKVQNKPQLQSIFDDPEGDNWSSQDAKREYDDIEENVGSDIFILRKGRGRPRKLEKERELQSLRIERPAAVPVAEPQKPFNFYRPQTSYQSQMLFQNQNVLARYKIKLERDYLNEIIQSAKQKEQLLSTMKRTDQDEIAIQQRHNIRREFGLFKPAACQIEAMEPYYQRVYSMDMELKMLTQKVFFEMIYSHHLIKDGDQPKLLFKCTTDNEEEYYVEYGELQTFCPTLLLDYMSSNAILL